MQINDNQTAYGPRPLIGGGWRPVQNSREIKATPALMGAALRSMRREYGVLWNLAQNPNLSKEDAFLAVRGLVARDIFSPSDAVEQMVVDLAGLADNSAELRQVVQSRMVVLERAMGSIHAN